MSVKGLYTKETNFAKTLDWFDPPPTPHLLTQLSYLRKEANVLILGRIIVLFGVLYELLFNNSLMI